MTDYRADRSPVLQLFNEVSATQIARTPRYRRHCYSAFALVAESVRRQFLRVKERVLGNLEGQAEVLARPLQAYRGASRSPMTLSIPQPGSRHGPRVRRARARAPGSARRCAITVSSARS